MASSAPRRSSCERSLRGDAGLVSVAVNVLAFAPLAWGPGARGQAPELRQALWEASDGLIVLPGRPHAVRAPGAGR